MAAAVTVAVNVVTVDAAVDEVAVNVAVNSVAVPVDAVFGSSSDVVLVVAVNVVAVADCCVLGLGSCPMLSFFQEAFLGVVVVDEVAINAIFSVVVVRVCNFFLLGQCAAGRQGLSPLLGTRSSAICMVV